MIITVSREFGSGGRELAKRLSEILGFEYYDKELVEDIANQSKFDERYVERVLTHSAHVLPYSIGLTLSPSSLHRQATEVLASQKKIITRLATGGNCIFVGRGAETVLEEFNPVKIFVYANKQSKLNRCLSHLKENENLTDRKMLRKMKEVDRYRKKLYLMLGMDGWGKKENYDLCINTSNISIKEVSKHIAPLILSIKNNGYQP